MKNINQLSVKVFIALCFIALILSNNTFAAKSGGGSKGGSKSGYVIGGTGPGGGIIFHVTDDGLHGLEAAPVDQSTGIEWYNGAYIETNASKSGINGGSFNTERIISAQGYGNYAALIAANYNGGGYGDWYLPSKDELNLMYQNLYLQGLGGFAADGYWSSTELDDFIAWGQTFLLFTGQQPSLATKGGTYLVFNCINDHI